MYRFVLALCTGLILGSASILPSYSAEGSPDSQATVCVGNWIEVEKAAEEQGVTSHELNDSKRIVFMKNYNADPPPTNVKANHVFIGVKHDNYDKVGYAVVQDDCVLDVGTMSVDLLEKWLATD